MLGAERLIYGRFGEHAVHGAPGRDAAAAQIGDTVSLPGRPTTCTGSTLPRRNVWTARRAHGRPGPTRSGSRTAAPASSRPRTRWPRSALGASHGYRAFECDVKLSADGVPFLLHDATLDRTTDGKGLAGDQDWSALARLDAGSWHGRAYAGEPLAELRSARRVLPGATATR